MTRRAPVAVAPGRREPPLADMAVALALGAVLAGAAFIANGGLQLGPATLVEIVTVGVCAVLVAAAIVLVGFEARLHGGTALAAVAVLAGITALSILWSLYPSDSWVEANRTLAYAAAFAAGIASVRLARERWRAVLWGVLLAIGAVCLYGMATKVAPGWLAEDEVYARLREPFGYWNAVGVTAAMGIPLCLWAGTRDHATRAETAVSYALLGLLLVTMLLSFSRGSILAALAGIALWLVLVPLRLRTLALLVPTALAAALVTVWAFAQGALTDDRVALGDREDAGLKFGLILLAMSAALAVGGLLIRSRAERVPLSELARRKIGLGALAALAAVPVIALGALAFSDRGIGGTVSDRWRDLTQEQSTPQNDPGRLIETGNVRTIYWARALDVWSHHRASGAGAGAFAQAQLRFRDQATQGRHAHGYIHQTLADLGLLGLGASLVALIAWLAAARTTLDLRRGLRRSTWSAERTGLTALALVAVIFGIHSAIDWTWFVPAVAITGLFAAGWVAGRGPLDPVAAVAGPPALGAVRAVLPSRPEGRPVLYRRLGGAALVVALAVIAALAVAGPWRADRKGDDALRLAARDEFAGARAAAAEARDINPLSVDPFFERAVIEDAAGNRRAALAALQDAVRLEPARPEAWHRLGEYLVNQLDKPGQAIPVLEAAVFLDPFSAQHRASYLVALRAWDLQRAELRDRRRRATLRAARRAQRAVAGTTGTISPAGGSPAPVQP